jgi:purine nucleoside phosphorylase
MGGHEVLWLPRHGDEHAIPPHRINYRANLYALEAAGATAVIAMNTVGVITERLRPGDIVIPAQLIDYTWGREHTYFDGTTGEVRHVEFSAPFTPALRERLLCAAGAAGIDCVDGGVYAVTQGPRLETPAEIDRLERDGADMVGMTAMPEAVLAAELGLEYAAIGLAVNPAAGRTEASLHAEVEKYSRAARDKAEALLGAFFGSDS